MSKFYVMRGYGLMAEYDNKEEAEADVENGYNGEWTSDKVLDHFPTKEEWECFMAEAKAVEEEYEAKCAKLREDHNRPAMYIHDDAHSQADSVSTREYEIGNVPPEDDGEKLAELVESMDGGVEL